MKAIITMILIFIGANAICQERFHISQYMGNQEYYNPSVIGSYGELNLAVLYRNQWTGFDGSPNVGMVSVFSPINGGANSIGLNLIYDGIGYSRKSIINFNYAYRLRIDTRHQIAFGIGGGIKHFAQDITQVEIADGDNYFIDNSVNRLSVDGSVGAYFFCEDYYVGLSGNSITETAHINLHGGYRIRLKEDFYLTPSTLLKYVSAAPLQMDINALLEYKMLGVGLSYRTSNDVVALVQLMATNKLKIGYSYDFNLSAGQLREQLGGSHEFYLRYRFIDSGDLAKIRAPRF